MAEYISREKLIEHLKKDPLFDLVERYGITGVIESIPAADVRPVVRGKWKKADVQPYFRKHFDIFVCSNCHARGQTKWNFCPNCGARTEES